MQRIVELTRPTGDMLTGAVKLDLETLNSFMLRWDSIIDIKLQKYLHGALQMMEAELK